MNEFTAVSIAPLETTRSKLLRQVDSRRQFPLSHVRNMRFKGPGAYLLYYNGDFELYAPISDSPTPIYVGESTKSVRLRVGEHLKSISEASNLVVDDFSFRVVVLMKGQSQLAETLLLEHFVPLWNFTIKGLGRHRPGHKRAEAPMSLWDSMHPGRKGQGTEPSRTNQEMAHMVSRHFSQLSVRMSGKIVVSDGSVWDSL